MKNEAEILWESQERNPNNNEPFFVVKRSRDYYIFGQRAGIDSIAFVLIDTDKEKVGLIYESKPPMDERHNEKHMMITAFGGSMDMEGKEPIEICKTEVIEEAGYDIKLNDIVSFGSTLVSSQMNQMCHCFAVNVTGLKASQTEADIKNEAQESKDPDEFIHNKVIWMSLEEVMQNNDWKSIFIISKYYIKLTNEF